MVRMREIFLAGALAFGLAGTAGAAEAPKPPAQSWSFDGIFGTFDRAALQRGYQVYKEVCAACHAISQIRYRDLGVSPGGIGLGYSEDEVKAIAADYTVPGDVDAAGDPTTREAKPFDAFPSPFPNDNAARAANGGALPPDLSLMAKARAGFSGPYGLGINQFLNGIGGPEYIASLLSGYTGEEKEEAGSVFYENTAFPGGWIAMAQPLYEDSVTYADGTPATVEQMSEDVAAFLMWAAEPRMNARKEAGFTAVLFLGVLAVLLYLTNKRLWAGIKGRRAA